MPKTHKLREFILRILDYAERKRDPSIALAALAKLRFVPTGWRVAKITTGEDQVKGRQ